MIPYIIIDDEYIAHGIIKGYADQLPHLKFMKSCYDAMEAMEYLRDNRVELIFLDLNMPKLSGFDFIKTLPNPPAIIVTTAYQEHALEGYELNVIDYLLKPFSFERFLKAVNKVPQQKMAKNDVDGQAKKDSRIFLYTDKQYVQVDTTDILYVEAAGNYVKVFLINEQLIIREKLSELLLKLGKVHFLQVHKSFAVAIAHIERVEGNQIKIREKYLPIGKYYKAMLMSLLG